MSKHDFDTPQPLASRRGFPVDPTVKPPPPPRKTRQGTSPRSKRTSAVDWVARLPEVGDPMLRQAMLVDRLYVDAAELVKQAQRQEAALLADVNRLWKPREVSAAKRASATRPQL